MNQQLNSKQSAPEKKLMLIPGIILATLILLVRYVIPSFLPEAAFLSIFGGVLLGLAVAVWWVFFSRAPRTERWLAFGLMVLSVVVTSQALHISIATANMGLMFVLHSIPLAGIALVVWAVFRRNLPLMARRISMVILIILSSGFWVLLRTEGMDGQGRQEFVWRWAPAHEDGLLSQSDFESAAAPIDSLSIPSEIQWSGFRGANRNGAVHGVQIGIDWIESAPVELWRKPIGPGCSSFAVMGDRLYTQEQRGDFEMVTCYTLSNGELVWAHSDSARFWDSHAGAGPRSTPTLSKGRVYTLGATGILNVLDAFDGSVVWSHSTVLDIDVQIPEWGITSSPLVVDSVIVIALSGQLLAYHADNGDLLWTKAGEGESYSSPHLVTLEGVKQIVFISTSGAVGILPANGLCIWEYELAGGYIIQPMQINESNHLLLCDADIKGMRRIVITTSNDGWIVREIWRTDELKPNFNDIVQSNGYVYGFEGPRLACIDIEGGKRMWRGGRYGGQMLLLAEQELLLVLSEQGDIALVKASPNGYMELSRLPAIKGKTWNHPVLVGNILVVRNAIEMAAFRMPTAYSDI